MPPFDATDTNNQQHQPEQDGTLFGGDGIESTMITTDEKNGRVAAAAASDHTTANNTARWTRHLPQAFGIRQSVEASKYRWCARESALWGIATGTTMTLHRFRMASPIPRAVNFGFLTFFSVFAGSYYFCVKRRDYQEQMIELMMRLNTFDHAGEMPEERPFDASHPFLIPNDNNNDDAANVVVDQQYVAHLPERKDWQSPLPSQDATEIFKPHDPPTPRPN